MDWTDTLLDKYRDRLIIVEEKKSELDVIKDLVDIIEWDLTILAPVQIGIIENNIRLNPEYKGEAINLHLFTVVKNSKSRLYYEEMLALGHKLYLPYFDEPKILIIWDEINGIQEVDSSLLNQDFRLLRGLTLSDIEEKNVNLMNYLSAIESWNTSLEGLSVEEQTFQKIREWQAR